MSTARVFADCLHANNDVDENTVITDHWLSFVSVRQEGKKADLNTAEDGELQLKLDDFCRRITALSQGRRTLLMGLVRVLQDDPKGEVARAVSRYCESRLLRRTGLDGLSADSGQTTVKPDGPGTDLVPFSNRTSILERFRGSALFATIQKLF